MAPPKFSVPAPTPVPFALLLAKVYVPPLVSMTSGALMFSTALVAVSVERIWMVPPLVSKRELPPVLPMKKLPAPVSKLMPPIFCVDESMTTGLPEVPYVPTAELNVAISVLVVTEVEPGAVLPPQFAEELQLAVVLLLLHVCEPAQAELPTSNVAATAKAKRLRCDNWNGIFVNSAKRTARAKNSGKTGLTITE